MRAVLYRGPHEIGVEEVAAPAAGPGEVVVRVSVCGVCGSDASEYDHGPVLTTPPVVLGHEFVGTVAELGDGVTEPPVGATVVCGAGVSCGECVMCRKGRTNLCRRYTTAGFQRDGGLAEYVVVPAEILLDVTETGLSDDTLALAQPLSIAVHAIRRSGLARGELAVIVGIGGIGAFLTVAAAATGARILAVDVDPARLEFARRLGAQHVHAVGEGPLTQALVELEWEPDVFFEASGHRGGLDSVLAAALPGATIVPVGIQHAPAEFDMGACTVRELTIVGTNAHVFGQDMPEAVRILGGATDWTEFAETVHPLEDSLGEGIARLADGTTTQIKTLIDPRIREHRPARHGRRHDGVDTDPGSK